MSIPHIQSLVSRGQAAEALARLAEMDSPEASVLRGLAYVKLGQNSQAVEWLLRGLEADPSQVVAHIALSRIFASSQPTKAAEHAFCAALLDENDAQTLRFAFDTLVQAGDEARAIIIGKALTRVDKNVASIWAEIGAIYLRQGNKNAAIEAYREACRIQPDVFEFQFKYGQLLLEQGAFGEASRVAKITMKLRPDIPEAWLLSAFALSEEGDQDGAERAIQRALKLKPEHSLARSALGFWMMEAGRFDEARPEILQALKVDPGHGFSYYNLARMHRSSDGPPSWRTQLKDHLERPETPIRDRSYMHYAMAKLSEDEHDFESSARHLEEANALAYRLWLESEPWDKDKYAESMALKRERFTSDRLAEAAKTGNQSMVPVLIVGMIRSGTSLLEQIVSSHPDVGGAGELPFWHENELKIYQDGELARKPLAAAGEQYLRSLKKIAPGKKRVTDKLPHNYALIGEVVCAFPRVKIIRLRRNPRDNAWSIWSTAFQRPPVFAHRKENIAFEYDQYEQMMVHWQKVLPPGQMLEVDYEGLVADKETWTRRIIEHLELDWDGRCLSHEQNDRAVKTPSLWQVRQPVYRTSVERWRRYEPWLGELASLPETLTPLP